MRPHAIGFPSTARTFSDRLVRGGFLYATLRVASVYTTLRPITVRVDYE